MLNVIQISCKGRDSVPDNDAVNQFVYEVSFFVDSSILCISLNKMKDYLPFVRNGSRAFCLLGPRC